MRSTRSRVEIHNIRQIRKQIFERRIIGTLCFFDHLPFLADILTCRPPGLDIVVYGLDKKRLVKTGASPWTVLKGGGENVSVNPRSRGIKTSLPRSEVERGNKGGFNSIYMVWRCFHHTRIKGAIYPYKIGLGPIEPPVGSLHPPPIQL